MHAFFRGFPLVPLHACTLNSSFSFVFKSLVSVNGVVRSAQETFFAELA